MLAPVATTSVAPSQPDADVAYETQRGTMFQGYAERALRSGLLKKYRRKIQLIFTSPPFPLNKKKAYGNNQGEEYLRWLADFAPLFKEFLAPKGSIVIELGNAWEPSKPIMSTLALRSLLEFQTRGDLNLCQQFVCYNPARLPSPAQWVNVERTRVKDSFTNVWWFSPDERPQADNTQVLTPYSDSMKKLLKTKKYNSGPRPSEHHIGEKSFLRDNHGAIPSNVLTFTNTVSSDNYLNYVREHNLPVHPARMPIGLPQFFIKFLTKPRQLVMDPFGGSNTTGAAAEGLKRRWISVEPSRAYIEGSWGRFLASQEAPNGHAGILPGASSRADSD